jgi:hypothetical protein
MMRFCRLLPWLLVAPLWGQGPTLTQASDPATESEPSSTQQQTSGTSKDRLFYTLPNFLTLENAGKVPPLTTAEKFKVTARTSFDPVEFVWIGALAGIGQAENSEPSFGQGAAGFAKRYGMQFADGTIENFMSKAIFPSFLHQDPRYYQSGKGSFMRRVGYAASRIVVTRSDSGNAQFNYSEIFGAATAAGISDFTYHPRDERNLRSAMDIWATQLSFDALGYVVIEFWPDIRRKLHKSKSD